MTHEERWENYLIPGTSRVLRNKLDLSEPYGVRDYQLLETLGREITLNRLDDLRTHPIQGKFDLQHLQRIHGYLLGDVYSWAGQLRDVNMAKLDVAYAPYERIEPIWKAEHTRLLKSRFLRGIESPDVFTSGLARFWGEINHAHAFREGNTRSQMVFFKQLSEQAGWSLEVQRFAPQHPDSLYESFVDARFYFQRSGDRAPLADTLAQVVSPVPAKQHKTPPGRTADERLLKERAAQRFPELQNIQLDQHGLNDAAEPAETQGNDYGI